jgi:hypothetical protein
MSYIVVGRFSEIDLNNVFVKHNNEPIINYNLLKKLVVSCVSIVLIGFLGDFVSADSLDSIEVFASNEYLDNHKPHKLDSIFSYIKWLGNLLKIIFSSVIGVIFSIAGWKWATDLSGSNQAEAKKIMKNCLIGGFFIWSGFTIGDIFVNKMEELLT